MKILKLNHTMKQHHKIVADIRYLIRYYTEQKINNKLAKSYHFQEIIII